MTIELPMTIDDGHGSVITFKEIVQEPDGDKVIFEGRVQPGCGPEMHIHYLQDEGFHVIQGTLAYQQPGQAIGYLRPGESTVLERNIPHKFWNSGDDEMIVEAYVKPAHNIIFYISALYASMKENQTTQPNPFDGAYLMTRYKNEYDFIGLPWFVKKAIIPITYFIGRVLGKYQKYQNAPAPVSLQGQGVTELVS